MSTEQEKIEEVVIAAAAGTAVVLTPWQQLVNGAKIAFATKKMAMAAWALFFGVSAATGAGIYSNMYSEGMTADQQKAQYEMQETIVELRTEVEELKGIKANHEHEHDPIVIPAPVFIEHTHENDHKQVVIPAPVFIEHTHENDHTPVVIPAPVLLPHEHEAQKSAPVPAPVLIEHEHDVPAPVLIEHEHEQPVVKTPEIEYGRNGWVIDGVWIEL